MRIYVASSWRNTLQGVMVDDLRDRGHSVYDFKADEGASFHWNEVGVDSDSEDIYKYLLALEQPRSEAGFRSDMGALATCDLCVMVLPCGNSAHLELGWAVGNHKLTVIVNDTHRIKPDLMYKMVDFIAPSPQAFYDWLAEV